MQPELTEHVVQPESCLGAAYYGGRLRAEL